MTETESVRKPIWLLKSTYYPDLRRRILTLLSLPKDSLFEVEYDSKWIDDEIKHQLKSNTSALKDKDAYVIFWDYGTLQFYPIRLCKVQGIQTGEPYRLSLKTGNLLAFKEPQTNFNNAFGTYLKDKGLVSESDAVSRLLKLVLSCDNGPILSTLRQVEEDDDEEWQRIVKYLADAKPIGSTPQFTESLFFRFQLIDEENFRPVKVKDGKYELRAKRLPVQTACIPTPLGETEVG